MAQDLMGDDRRGMWLRLSMLQVGLAAVVAVLAVSFWLLQVAQHSKFRQRADNNHQRTLTLRAPRGVLFDRDGKVLVENRYSFDISIVRELTPHLDRSIDLLAAITGVNLMNVRAEVDRHLKEPTYRPIVLIRDASLSQIAAVAARRIELPGVVIEQVPTRHYRTGTSAAHLFGYVGEITSTQVALSEFDGFRTGAIVGQSGVERAYNRLLMGTDGARRVVVNSVGREIDTIEEIDPIEGRRLQLTIDYDLQRATEEGFASTGYSGAAVIMQPQTGEILAMASVPAYDPNAFALGIDPTQWRDLNADRLNPLHNRALQGRYSPGSTFKIVVAIAALEEGLVTPDFKVRCHGVGTFYGRPFHCHLPGGHGTLDMRSAIEKSCNVYFYTLGSMLDIDMLRDWATALGLGQRTGIDLPHEVEGIVPSREWKRRVKGEPWYPGETISVSIGQGALAVTPLSMAVMMATVANGGTRPIPHLLKAVDSGTGWDPVKAPPGAVVELQPETVKALHEGLWRVVNAQGTGRRGRVRGFEVAGKTGTTQLISRQGRAAVEETDLDLRDHGWFVFFAPTGEAPELAGVVLAEHAEHGYLAAPIARHVMATYVAKREGRPLPRFPQPVAPAPATTVETDPRP